MSIDRPKRLGEDAVKSKALQVINPFLLRRAMRFALTGVFVTGVHFVIAIVVIELIIPSPPLANGVAFACATIVSYLINTIWIFSGNLHGRTLFRFVVVSVLGFFLAMFVAWAAEVAGLSYLLGICAVALTILPMTFVMHNFWTYR
jgi:putative flippase GtrA